jgi:hypothetical protein
MEPLDTNLNPEPAGSVNEKGVLFGHQGFLFFKRTAGQAVRWYQPVSDQLIADIRRSNAARIDRAHTLGATFSAVLQPGKSVTLPHVYPGEPAINIADDPRFPETLALDATATLRGIGEACFWKTDPHLAPRGAIAMAILFARATGLVPEQSLVFLETSLPKLVERRTAFFVGETGIRCSPPRGEWGYRFAPALTISAAAYDGKADFTQKHPQEGDLVLAYSPDALFDKTVVVFGTSMVNAYIGPLAHIFTRVVWARTQRYVYWDVVEAARADAVISLTQGGSSHDVFPTDDYEAPAFMAISKYTGRTLVLRNNNPHLFADMLPGLMESAKNAPPPSTPWLDNVVGVKGYKQNVARPRFTDAPPSDPLQI